MSDIIDRFTFLLPNNASIIDVGCGSGRDLLSFRMQGLKAIGIEPAVNLAKFAAQYSGAEVINVSLQEYKTDIKFDGAWVCASLIHIPTSSLQECFDKLSSLLKPNGYLYTSFKLGHGVLTENGRTFYLHNPEEILEVCTKKFSMHYTGINEDKRQHNATKWINLILKKKKCGN